MKKDSKKKKSGKKKGKQQKSESPEMSRLVELTDTVKSMAGELKKLRKINKSLKADIKKIKKKSKNKKEKEPEVVTKVMEPQVLPPTKVKSKGTKKAVPAKAKTAGAKKPLSTSKAKPAPKSKAKPGPKPKPAPKANSAAVTRSRTPKKAVTPGRPSGPEDLLFLQGLGAKIKSFLHQQGIKTFADLAKATQASVKSALQQAGPRFKNQDPKPLIEQAKLIKAEKWSELEAFQAELMKGKKKPGPKGGNK